MVDATGHGIVRRRKYSVVGGLDTILNALSDFLNGTVRDQQLNVKILRSSRQTTVQERASLFSEILFTY